MPQVRNVSNDSRDVPGYGLTVRSGDVMDVPDGDVESWKHQEGVWELVVAAPKSTPKSSNQASPAVTEGA